MLRPQDVAVTQDHEGEEGEGDRNLILKGEKGKGASPNWQNARKGEALGRLPLSLSRIFDPMLSAKHTLRERPYTMAG